MRTDRFELPLRIVVDNPIPGLAMGLQRGSPPKEVGVEPPVAGAALRFDLSVVVDGALADGRPRLLGPYVQGPPTGRFIYLCVGQYAGQADSPWAGRVKAPLGGVTWDLIEGLADGARLEGHIPGRGRKDGPALASVPILPPGWRASKG
jgi:Family of unknown function (DUF5990)